MNAKSSSSVIYISNIRLSLFILEDEFGEFSIHMVVVGVRVNMVETPEWKDSAITWQHIETCYYKQLVTVHKILNDHLNHHTKD